MSNSFDFLIVGAGMVGLSLAHQITEKRPNSSILIIDKESDIGFHSSGRNSGVLHAGIYYPPNTLKAQVCVTGARRLREWCETHQIPVLSCGKVIVPQSTDLDSQLDLLYERGKSNGAEVEIINQQQFDSLVPHGRTSTGRALWSPNTCVVKPKQVIAHLKLILESRGVQFLFDSSIQAVEKGTNSVQVSTTGSGTVKSISYGYLFNSAGLQADRVAKKFGFSQNYKLLPFKGIYWKLDPRSKLSFSTNLYPVPDLNVPFLGVHVTPSPDGTISLGPTAIPALGRENYRGLQGLEPLMAADFLLDIAKQWVQDNGGFRQYAREQALHGIKPLFLKAAQKLVPELKSNHLVPSEKVGIRAQLFDQSQCKLVQDFLLEYDSSSAHVLNAISPAFTASFELADLILQQTHSI